MKIKTFLFALVSLLLSLGAKAQNDYSDIVDINKLIEVWQNGDDNDKDMALIGYKNSGWHHIEGLNTQYGELIYYRNCTVNKKGEPKTFSKGNTSLVGFVHAGFGPCCYLTVFNRGAYNYIYGQLLKAGYKKIDNETLRKGELEINPSHSGKSYSFTVWRNNF